MQRTTDLHHICSANTPVMFAGQTRPARGRPNRVELHTLCRFQHAVAFTPLRSGTEKIGSALVLMPDQAAQACRLKVTASDICNRPGVTGIPVEASLSAQGWRHQGVDDPPSMLGRFPHRGFHTGFHGVAWQPAAYSVGSGGGESHSRRASVLSGQAINSLASVTFAKISDRSRSVRLAERNQVRFNAPCLAHIKSGLSLGKPLFSQWCASGHQEYLTLVSSVRRIPG